MSGPKGGSYRVEAPALQEARALRDAKADYVRADIEWGIAATKMAVAAAAAGSPVDFERPAAIRHGDSAAWVRAAGDLRSAALGATAHAAQVRGRAAEAQHADRIAQMIASVDHGPRYEAPVANRRSRWQATRDEPRPAQPLSDVYDEYRVRERVRRRLDELATLAHDAAKVDTLVADIGAARLNSRVDLLVGELDFVLAEARTVAERVAQRGQVRAELAAMQSRLNEIASPAAQVLRRQVARAIDSDANELPNGLAEAVHEVIAAADADADRQHVVRVMSAALLELGYSPGPEFTTTLTGDRATAYARNGSTNYGVKLRIEPGSNRFTAQAVKSDATLTSAAEDENAERDFCSDFAKLLDIAAREGVSVDVNVRTHSGTSAVQQVAASYLGSAAEAAARTKATRARERRTTWRPR